MMEYGESAWSPYLSDVMSSDRCATTSFGKAEGRISAYESLCMAYVLAPVSWL